MGDCGHVVARGLDRALGSGARDAQYTRFILGWFNSYQQDQFFGVTMISISLDPPVQ